jgi:DNA mismatch repair protein MutL
MFPVTAELNPADYLVLSEIEKDLNLLGFRFEHREGNLITITGKPAISDSPDTMEMLEILLDDFKSKDGPGPEKERERVASAMAGASAIPYGKPLDNSQMEDLFDSLFACRTPNYSPKGKPVISILTLEDIDRKFG